MFNEENAGGCADGGATQRPAGTAPIRWATMKITVSRRTTADGVLMLLAALARGGKVQKQRLLEDSA